MRKIFFLSAFMAATGLMTSCSQDDDITSSPTSSFENTAIVFSTNSPQTAVTRAAGTTVTSLSQFYVTAVNSDNSAFFQNELFKYKGSTFAPETPRYWPTTGTLSFYAINETGDISYSNNVPQHSFNYFAGKSDLVAATVIAGEKTVPYPLTFKHILSQIYVSAEAENKTEDLTYKITSIKLTAPSSGGYSYGTSTGSTGSWVVDGTKTSTYSYSDALPASFKKNGRIGLESCYWNILPTTTGTLHFDVEYQVIQNGKVINDFTGDKKKTCEISNPNLVMGKKYTYNFILTRSANEAISFSATISDWGEGGNSNQTPNKADIAENTAIDLGLSVKWAQGNLGAETETEDGLFYAWGETVGHTSTSGYNFSTANYEAGSAGPINTDLSLSQDAANVKLGGTWRMPTKAEYQELINKTTSSWTTINGVWGTKFTANNGNYVFFPASGYFSGLSLEDVGEYGNGYYWSSSINSDIWSSTLLRFDNGSIELNDYNRSCGMSIRAVCP